jgi:hypothetical protein
MLRLLKKCRALRTLRLIDPWPGRNEYRQLVLRRYCEALPELTQVTSLSVVRRTDIPGMASLIWAAITSSEEWRTRLRHLEVVTTRRAPKIALSPLTRFVKLESLTVSNTSHIR